MINGLKQEIKNHNGSTYDCSPFDHKCKIEVVIKVFIYFNIALVNSWC